MSLNLNLKDEDSFNSHFFLLNFTKPVDWNQEESHAIISQNGHPRRTEKSMGNLGNENKPHREVIEARNNHRETIGARKT